MVGRGIAIVLILAGFSATLAGKGSTSRISISGGDLASSLEIRDPRIVEQFQIWTGPGTQTCLGGRGNCVEGTEGFIVNWSAGPVVVEKPSGLQRYEISFFVVDERFPGQTHHEEVAYVVLYEYDPARWQGFVYLPGQGDQWYTLNSRSIYRRLEGNWFRATRAWQDVVVPLISPPR
jgi:hypothetical protein